LAVRSRGPSSGEGRWPHGFKPSVFPLAFKPSTQTLLASGIRLGQSLPHFLVIARSSGLAQPPLALIPPPGVHSSCSGVSGFARAVGLPAGAQRDRKAVKQSGDRRYRLSSKNRFVCRDGVVRHGGARCSGCWDVSQSGEVLIRSGVAESAV